MCGVVSIVYEKDNKNIGVEACNLLRRLEYRGYDSTGAAFIDEKKQIFLRKKVGAPSKVVYDLNIDKFYGKIFIGQVRWATFGAVTDKNSQPHIVNCFLEMVGAHNGNISNTDVLKEFLESSGHKIISDNDGEIIVHLIEHYFNLNLNLYKNDKNYIKDYNNQISLIKEILSKSKLNKNYDFDKIILFLDAIRKADAKANGSYAACVSFPEIDGVFAVKSGSSLYAGIGEDDEGNFVLVSSDLTSVLSKTRFLIPLNEGEGIFFNNELYFIFSLKDELKINQPLPKRSKLNVKDTALSPRYHFYMEQEIFSSVSNIDDIILYYFLNEKEKNIFNVFEENKEEYYKIFSEFINLGMINDKEKLIKEFEKFINNKELEKSLNEINNLCKYNNLEFISEEKQFLSDLLKLFPEKENYLYLLDKIILWKKKRKINYYFNYLIFLILKTYFNKGRIFSVASGTSYHASLTGAYFFNNLTSCSIIAENPGGFRSNFINTINKNDLLIVVSQSGETKDLVDIIQDVKKICPDIHVISIVNNENSRIPQELSNFYIPILCGPEIAVAATKSFINQIVIFYILANKVSKVLNLIKGENIDDLNNIYKYIKIVDNDYNDELIGNILKIKELISYTLKRTDKDLTEVALKFYLKPSIHILGTSLIGIAKEGALKIREVVLNHTEGYDSAEFKHGPNTILGKNTIFSIEDISKLLNDIIEFLKREFDNVDIPIKPEVIKRYLKVLSKYGLERDKEFLNTYKENNSDEIDKFIYNFLNQINIENYFSNYPLIFICSNDERDKRITISQIHTHKIRGADIVLIAERDEELYKAISNKPSNSKEYFYKYIEIEESGDKNLFVFPTVAILQNLAFKMSVLKMKYLNSLKIENHGVHPDAPKNVSKSITVD